MQKPGLTLIELLVALFVVAVLMSLLFVAVQAARESSRRITCSNNLRQIGIAIAAYESSLGAFPPGANAQGYSAHVTLLNYLDNASLAELYRQVDQSADPETGNEQVRRRPPVVYRCPSDSESFVNGRSGGTNYGLCFGTGVQAHAYNGAFRQIALASPKYPSGVTRASNVSDGLSNTVFLAEILTSNGLPAFLRTNWYTERSNQRPEELADFARACLAREYRRDRHGQPRGNVINRGRPWIYGDAGITFYNHVLSPNSPSCVNGTKVQLGAYSAASLHRRGVNTLFGDGRVSFVSDDVESSIWTEFGSIYSSGMN